MDGDRNHASESVAPLADGLELEAAEANSSSASAIPLPAGR